MYDLLSCTQAVLKDEGGAEEAALLLHPSRRPLRLHSPRQQRAPGHPEEGGYNPSVCLTRRLTFPQTNRLTPQVVERLEADLGVKVQQVRLPELRYGFQIWNMYMGLPDQDGNVSPPEP